MHLIAHAEIVCPDKARMHRSSRQQSSPHCTHKPYTDASVLEQAKGVVCCHRRGGILAGAIALGLALSSPQPSQALPRGSIDARVAASFNTALAAGGDPVVRCHMHVLAAVARFECCAKPVASHAH